MKKVLLTLAMTSFVAFTATGCPSPADALKNAVGGSNGNGTAGGGGTTTLSGALASKSAYIAFLNCLKLKVPQASVSIDAAISGVNSISDAQWNAAVSASPASYDALIKLYGQAGCQ